MIQLTEPFQVTKQHSQFDQYVDNFIQFLLAFNFVSDYIVIVPQDLNNLGQSSFIFLIFGIVELIHIFDISIDFKKERAQSLQDQFWV